MLPLYTYHSRTSNFSKSLFYNFSHLSLQDRVFCKAASENEKFINRRDGYVGVEFSKSVVLGNTTIAKYFKSAAKRMGLPNWENFGAHSLRRMHATTLVNTSGVSLKEAMSSMRHSRFVFFHFLFQIY